MCHQRAAVHCIRSSSNPTDAWSFRNVLGPADARPWTIRVVLHRHLAAGGSTDSQRLYHRKVVFGRSVSITERQLVVVRRSTSFCRHFTSSPCQRRRRRRRHGRHSGASDVRL